MSLFPPFWANMFSEQYKSFRSALLQESKLQLYHFLVHLQAVLESRKKVVFLNEGFN